MTIPRLLILSLLAGTASACISGSAVHGEMFVTTAPPTPDLALVAPGVYVIENSEPAVFYSDGYYWKQDGGAWKRSMRYTCGWQPVETVPYAVARIEPVEVEVRSASLQP
jgi:hypothetical protein